MTKFSQWYKEVVLPAGLLSSAIIGAGVFALPFVFYQAGFLIGLFYLTLFTVAFTAVHRMYAEVIENTEGRHGFVGYARIYFKKWGFATAIITTAIGFTLTLVAYVILAGEFIGLMSPRLGELAPFIFWAVGSLSVIIPMKRFANLEFGLSLAMCLIIIVLFAVGVSYGEVHRVRLLNPPSFFAPYGVVLFALAGRAAISAIYEYYERRKISKAKLPTAITIGTIIPAVVYVLFIIGVLSISGGSVTEDALSGLGEIARSLLLLVGTLGLFALWTSYFILAREVKGIFVYDLKLGKVLSILAVVVLPIWLYTSGLTSFIGLLAIVGGVFLAIDSIMAILMYSKIKGWKLSTIALFIVFAIGALYEIMNI
ncbi:MAG: hypothetical protein A3G58_02215 [Candidatus Colwellbacteria bacterium RIFCSPLOWO2_12_FULL_46_17]|uniref:Amino acid transporter transmembrane domain-containing protein n=2 Tax=Candidatus Colwelliibacteriota TaxID=1817904 RepID=A0A1G1ZE55_9BACT|nr:MAG: hypothetical protein A3I33_02375 [Candidatus Colwellbacteria bacterium RIFCSPLOWO2_02_FULL_45_11]OGY62190.1 MAG: hypothetical protein A3G58_02215 [Candidatus Colwellbacteria bacterium RIFCSPLOWO2_12_FULL_46_17]